MPQQSQLIPEPEMFKVKGPTEAICLKCFATIRTAKDEALTDALQRHVSECGGRC